MDNFTSLNLPEALNHTLAAMKFTTPTPIQAQAIPAALDGRDVLGSAQTGTGKTGAFGIPLVAKLMANSRGSALVMTPTRELAVQVLAQLQMMLGKHSNIKAALLIGGDSMPKQLQQLRARPRLLVGTPGRINDHLTRGSLMLHDTGFLVLDETDRMLDMGFQVQIEKIMKFMPKQRQTLLFSATLPTNIVKISRQYMNDPVRVAADDVSQAATNIKQEVIHLSEAEKYPQFLTQLKQREGSIIVFIKTKHGADKMADRLRKVGHDAEAIHGDLRQNQRDRVIAAFRNKKHRILVATDVAARGLDIPHIEHVINYDLPQCPEDYIHRIGRTARAGAEGASLAFVTPAERIKWNAIERMFNPDAKMEKSSEHRGGSAGRGPRSGKGGGNAANSDANRNAAGKRRPASHARRAKNTSGESNGNGGAYAGGKPNAEGKPFRDSKPSAGGKFFKDSKPSGSNPSRSGERTERSERTDRTGGAKPAFGDKKPSHAGQGQRDGQPRRKRFGASGGAAPAGNKPRGQGNPSSGRPAGNTTRSAA